MGASGVGAEKEKYEQVGHIYIIPYAIVGSSPFLMESKVGIVYRQVMDRYVHF